MPVPGNTYPCHHPGCENLYTAKSYNHKYCEEHQGRKWVQERSGKEKWEGPDRECVQCGVMFSPDHWLTKYCPDHSGRASEVERTETKNRRRNETIRQRRAEKRELIANMPERWCERPGCGKLIKGERLLSPRTKYCSGRCGSLVATNRSNARAKERKTKVEIDAGQHDIPKSNRRARLGETYAKIKNNSQMEGFLLDGTMPYAVAANHLETTEASVSRAMEAVRFDVEMEKRKDSWSRSEEIENILPREVLSEARETDEASPRFNELVELLVESYIAFQNKFFEIAPGKRFIVKDFHRIWIKSIIVAWLTGGKQLILSPPRHGKSELLIRFVVWAIVLDFNIRVMWVAANQDVAKLMLGAVKDHLENNEDLIAAVLPPGEVFRPTRQSSKTWTSTEIRIAQLNVVGQKSSTMLALGRTSSILSRDVDILIVDDLEDFDSTREPSQREYGRQKYAEIGTRKEEGTCWVNIGSRQHPEDLTSHLMETASEQGWKVIINSAHDEGCGNDPDDYDAHNECVLFPEVRTYRWLMEKKLEMDDLGLEGAYDMRYLNAPRPTKGLVFRVEVIRTGCLDRSRDLGTTGIPPGRLIAGLDPAARGTQAAFCWLWTPEMLYMVDLETQEAGGFEGAIRVMDQWDDAYQLKDWKYEDNFQQVEFFSDPRLKKLQGDTGISVRPYRTGKNKQDPELGLSAMAPLYHGGRINLPYGTRGARVKVDALLRQLQNWTTEGKSRRGKTDIKMASWFPFPTILHWNKEDRKINLVDQDGSYGGIRTMNDVGWQTNYPGGF